MTTYVHTNTHIQKKRNKAETYHSTDHFIVT